MLRTAWVSLKKLYNVKELEETNLEIFFDLSECIKKVDFIQESAPEILSLKQSLYKELGEIVPKNVIICSSTSGMKMTDIQTLCKTPERTVVAHPFNPPYLLPLVEIVGGRKTKEEAVNWVYDFFIKIGKSPLVLKKEIPGFVATRLQEALWREALHMVENNEATPEQIDIALMNGPAPRMAIQGQCLAFHVACGEGGMATNLDQFGPALELPWTRLKAPELTKKLRDKMVDGCEKIVKDQKFQDLASERDKKIVEIIKIQRK
jgi:carnitine 3-dehydrogenase